MARKPLGGQGLEETPRPYTTAQPVDDPAVTAFLYSTVPANEAAARHGLPGAPKAPRLPRPGEADAAILRRNIRRRMAWLDKKPRAAALEAGLNDGAVRQILEGRSQMPRAGTLEKLAPVLRCRPEDLTGDSMFGAAVNTPDFRRVFAQRLLQAEEWRAEAGTASGNNKKQLLEMANSIDFIDGPYEWDQAGIQQVRDMRNRLAHPQNPLPPVIGRAQAVPLVMGEKDFPVYAAAQGGTEGVLILDFNPVDFVRRPEPVIGVHDAFGVLVVDESMVPALEHGDMAIVNPRLPPIVGKNAFFTRTTPDNETYAMVKRLESMSRTEWSLRQFNPDKRFKVSRSEWPQCLPIIGKYDRR